MKIIFLIIALIGFTFQPAFAQNKKVVTDTIPVSGNCSMCKKTIENAAYIDGVKRAEWNEETKELTVTYKTKKTDIQEIAQHVAAAGYDANGIVADEKAYQDLPKCCAYKSGEECTH